MNTVHNWTYIIIILAVVITYSTKKGKRSETKCSKKHRLNDKQAPGERNTTEFFWIIDNILPCKYNPQGGRKEWAPETPRESIMDGEQDIDKLKGIVFWTKTRISNPQIYWL